MCCIQVLFNHRKILRCSFKIHTIHTYFLNSYHPFTEHTFHFHYSLIYSHTLFSHIATAIVTMPCMSEFTCQLNYIKEYHSLSSDFRNEKQLNISQQCVYTYLPIANIFQLPMASIHLIHCSKWVCVCKWAWYVDSSQATKKQRGHEKDWP